MQPTSGRPATFAFLLSLLALAAPAAAFTAVGASPDCNSSVQRTIECTANDLPAGLDNWWDALAPEPMAWLQVRPLCNPEYCIIDATGLHSTEGTGLIPYMEGLFIGELRVDGEVVGRCNGVLDSDFPFWPWPECRTRPEAEPIKVPAGDCVEVQAVTIVANGETARSQARRVPVAWC